MTSTRTFDERAESDGAEESGSCEASPTCVASPWDFDRQAAAANSSEASTSPIAHEFLMRCITTK
jgi:hypothetical protein